MVCRLLASAVLLISAGPVSANTIAFSTGTQLLGGYAESASAEFEINDTLHSITVHLLNLQLNPSNVNQAIGSLRFTLTGAGTPMPDPIPTGISDTRLDIANNGSPTNITPETTTVWRTSASAQAAGWQLQLCTVCAGGGTDGLIIGGPDSTGAGGRYSAADATLAGGSGAQWILGSGLAYTGSGNSNKLTGRDSIPDFTIQFQPTVSLANVKITHVLFGFGEDANFGFDYIDVPVETPEPEQRILILTGLGMLAVSAGVRRWRQR